MFPRLMTKRARAQMGTLGTILAISMITGLILSGSLAFISASTADGISQQFSTLNPVMKVQQYQTQLLDAEKQAAAAGEVLHTQLPSQGIRVEAQVRSYVQDYLVVASGSTLPLAGTPDQFSADIASLVSGQWPSAAATAGDAAPVAIAQSTAESLGIALGETVNVLTNKSEFQVQVQGIYEPLGLSSGFWEVDPHIATGFGEVGSFPVVYSPADFSRLFSIASLRMNLIAVPEALNANSVEQLLAALPKVNDLLRKTSDFSGKGMSQGGGLVSTLNGVQDALVSVRAVTPVPILLIVMLSIIALSQLGVLLNTSRNAETVLFKSRGFSLAKLSRANLVEAAVVTLPLALAGALLAIPLLAVFTGDWVHWLEPLLLGLGVGLLATGIVYLLGRQELQKPLNRETVNDSGRAKTVMQAGLVVLIAVAAGYSLWQFKIHGSAIIIASNGDVSLDWVSLFAPVLLILVFSLVSLMFLGPLTRILAAFRSRNVSGYLSRIQVSRRITIFTVSFALVSLAAASIVFASAYAGSWQAVNIKQNAIVNPSGAKLSLPQSEFKRLSESSFDSDRSHLGGLSSALNEGLNGSAALNLLPASYADKSLEFLAVPKGLEQVLPEGGAIEGRSELLELAGLAAVSGIPIPAGSSALNLDLSSTYAEEEWVEVYIPQGDYWEDQPVISSVQNPTEIVVTLWLSDGRGGIQTFVKRFRGESIRSTVSIQLPKLEGEWHLIDIQTLQPYVGSGEYVLDWHGISIDSPSGATAVELGKSFVRDAVRLSGFFAIPELKRDYFTGNVVEAIPGLVPETMLESLGLAIGDTIEVQFPGSNRMVKVQITATAPAIPGTVGTLSIAVPLADFQQILLKQAMAVPKPNLYWFALSEAE
ncbi:MAG: hypothetical protein WBA28_05350, partial [Microbacteriaceae bacterium]